MRTMEPQTNFKHQKTKNSKFVTFRLIFSRVNHYLQSNYYLLLFSMNLTPYSTTASVIHTNSSVMYAVRNVPF